MKNSHNLSLDVLNLKILFISMINLNMFFDFMIMIFKNDMFSMHLNEF
jgi:hypothetical protein